MFLVFIPLQRRYNGHSGVSNHQPHYCLLNRLFGRRSNKTSKLLVTGLCVGNSPGTGEFPAQMASNAENVSIRWRHHARYSWRHLTSANAVQLSVYPGAQNLIITSLLRQNDVMASFWRNSNIITSCVQWNLQGLNGKAVGNTSNKTPWITHISIHV